MMTDPDLSRNSTDVSKILSAVKSPLGFLTFAAVICEFVFGLVGAFTNQPELIIYAMHMFLAIVGTLVLLSVWCPRALYDPNDIKDIKIEESIDNTGKWVVTVSLLIALVAYMGYQLILKYYFPGP